MTAFVLSLFAPISQAVYENKRRFRTKKSQYNSKNTYFFKKRGYIGMTRDSFSPRVKSRQSHEML